MRRPSREGSTEVAGVCELQDVVLTAKEKNAYTRLTAYAVKEVNGRQHGRLQCAHATEHQLPRPSRSALFLLVDPSDSPQRYRYLSLLGVPASLDSSRHIDNAR